jgi:hypothetical protein
LAGSLALVGRFDLVMGHNELAFASDNTGGAPPVAGPTEPPPTPTTVWSLQGARPIAGAAAYPDGKGYDGAPGEHTSMENPG